MQVFHEIKMYSPIPNNSGFYKHTETFLIEDKALERFKKQTSKSVKLKIEKVLIDDD